MRGPMRRFAPRHHALTRCSLARCSRRTVRRSPRPNHRDDRAGAPRRRGRRSAMLCAGTRSACSCPPGGRASARLPCVQSTASPVSRRSAGMHRLCDFANCSGDSRTHEAARKDSQKCTAGELMMRSGHGAEQRLACDQSSPVLKTSRRKNSRANEKSAPKKSPTRIAGQ